MVTTAQILIYVAILIFAGIIIFFTIASYFGLKIWLIKRKAKKKKDEINKMIEKEKEDERGVENERRKQRFKRLAEFDKKINEGKPTIKESDTSGTVREPENKGTTDISVIEQQLKPINTAKGDFNGNLESVRNIEPQLERRDDDNNIYRPNFK